MSRNRLVICPRFTILGEFLDWSFLFFSLFLTLQDTKRDVSGVETEDAPPRTPRLFESDDDVIITSKAVSPAPASPVPCADSSPLSPTRTDDPIVRLLLERVAKLEVQLQRETNARVALQARVITVETQLAALVPSPRNSPRAKTSGGGSLGKITGKSISSVLQDDPPFPQEVFNRNAGVALPKIPKKPP